MKLAEYLRHDAVGLAAAIDTKAVSASEVIEIAIAATEAVNVELNAVAEHAFEAARKRASSDLSGAFAGVPVFVKDTDSLLNQGLFKRIQIGMFSTLGQTMRK